MRMPYALPRVHAHAQVQAGMAYHWPPGATAHARPNARPPFLLPFPSLSTPLVRPARGRRLTCMSGVRGRGEVTSLKHGRGPGPPYGPPLSARASRPCMCTLGRRPRVGPGCASRCALAASHSSAGHAGRRGAPPTPTGCRGTAARRVTTACACVPWGGGVGRAGVRACCGAFGGSL